MAVNVTSLRISLQEGTDNTAYATWEFSNNTPLKPSGGGSSGGGGSGGGGGGGGGGTSVRVGSIVKVKPGSRWYNGASIDSFIFNDRWIVYEISGSRAVIHYNRDRTHAIMSPIHVNNLEVVG